MKQQEVVKQATAGIIRDGEDSESDEEDVNTRQSSSAVASKLDDGEAHNKLIQGIMNEEEEKKKKNKKAEEEKNDAAPVKKQESGGIRMGRLGKKKKKKKDKNRSMGGGQKFSDDSGSSKKSGGEMSSDQLEQLREAIQTLCQSINPLAKCMDYVSCTEFCEAKSSLSADISCTNSNNYRFLQIGTRRYRTNVQGIRRMAISDSRKG